MNTNQVKTNKNKKRGVRRGRRGGRSNSNNKYNQQQHQQTKLCSSTTINNSYDDNGVVVDDLSKKLENTYLTHNNNVISLLALILLRVNSKSRRKCKQVCLNWNKLLMTSPLFETDRILYLNKCYLTENREPVTVLMNSLYQYNKCVLRVTDDFCDDTVPEKFWNTIGEIDLYILPSNDEVSNLTRLNWIKSIQNLKSVKFIRFYDCDVLFGILKSIKVYNTIAQINKIPFIEKISDEVQCLEFNNDPFDNDTLMDLFNDELLQVLFPNLINIAFVNSHFNCCKLSYDNILCPYNISIRQKCRKTVDLIVSNEINSDSEDGGNFADYDNEDFNNLETNNIVTNNFVNCNVDDDVKYKNNKINGYIDCNDDAAADDNGLECLETLSTSESEYSDVLIDDAIFIKNNLIDDYFEQNSSIRIKSFEKNNDNYNYNDAEADDNYDRAMQKMKNEKIICFFDHNIHAFNGVKKLIMDFRTIKYCFSCFETVLNSFCNLKSFVLWIDFEILKIDFTIFTFLNTWPHLESINIDTNECNNFLNINTIANLQQIYPNINSICINNEFPSDDFINIIPKIFPNLRILKFDGVMSETNVNKIIKGLLIKLPKLIHLRFLITKPSSPAITPTTPPTTTSLPKLTPSPITTQEAVISSSTLSSPLSSLQAQDNFFIKVFDCLSKNRLENIFINYGKKLRVRLYE